MRPHPNFHFIHLSVFTGTKKSGWITRPSASHALTPFWGDNTKQLFDLLIINYAITALKSKYPYTCHFTAAGDYILLIYGRG